MNYFLIRLWCGTKSGFYMTTSDDQLSSWTEKKLQSTFQNQTCIKKRSWLLFGCLLPIWSTIAFWILAKSWHTSKKCAQQINEMHRKLQHLQLALVSRKGPILLHEDAQPHITQPTVQKLNELGYVVCLIPPYSPDLLLTTSISTTFCGENTSTTSRRQKMLSKNLPNPEAWILHYQNKQTYFSLAKNVLIVSVC